MSLLEPCLLLCATRDFHRDDWFGQYWNYSNDESHRALHSLCSRETPSDNFHPRMANHKSWVRIETDGKSQWPTCPVIPVIKATLRLLWPLDAAWESCAVISAIEVISFDRFVCDGDVFRRRRTRESENNWIGGDLFYQGLLFYESLSDDTSGRTRASATIADSHSISITLCLDTHWSIPASNDVSVYLFGKHDFEEEGRREWLNVNFA